MPSGKYIRTKKHRANLSIGRKAAWTKKTKAERSAIMSRLATIRHANMSKKDKQKYLKMMLDGKKSKLSPHFLVK